jgi:hypothetical protein
MIKKPLFRNRRALVSSEHFLVRPDHAGGERLLVMLATRGRAPQGWRAAPRRSPGNDSIAPAGRSGSPGGTRSHARRDRLGQPRS